MRALGTIVESYNGIDPTTSVHCGLLDYYDDWNKVDPRLAAHYHALSRASDVFGHDLVNTATYVSEILGWLPPQRIRLPPSVVCVASMTEAFLVSIRSAYDAVAIALSYLCCEKKNQAPTDSLRSLYQWVKRNPELVRPSVRALLSQNHSAFWDIRTLRDHVVHCGAHATIHTDGRQFNLWVYSVKGWVTREPLLPLLAHHVRELIAFAETASKVINEIIDLPKDRLRSRAVEGVLIGSLHRLEAIHAEYATPSP